MWVCVLVLGLMKCVMLQNAVCWVFKRSLPALPTDDSRLFGFVRITTGDAMSKRAKFTLITWIGENISGLQRAKISTDKAMVKEIVQVRAAFGVAGRQEQLR